MRKSRVAFAFLIVLALVPGTLVHGAAPPVPGSFLKQRVYSVDDLVTQLSKQKVVSTRYTQHFKSSQNTLVAYFRDNLKLSTLRKPTVTTVYYVNKAGKIVRGKRLLPTGTPVFVSKSGEVVLDGRCGNPLRADLPRSIKSDALAKKQPDKVKIQKKNAGKTVVASDSAQNQGKSEASSTTAKLGEQTAQLPTQNLNGPVVEKVLGNQPMEIAALPFATNPTITAEAINPAIVSATPMAPPPVVEAVATAPTAAIPPVIASVGKRFNFLPLALLGGLGAAAGLAGGGDNPAPTPLPVPEPVGVVTLASGMMGMAVFAIRRRRS